LVVVILRRLDVAFIRQEGYRHLIYPLQQAKSVFSATFVMYFVN